MRLKDKVCVVTGGAQGLGFACARAFAREGAKVMIGDINAEIGEKAAAGLAEEGFAAAFTACDVSDSAQVNALVAAAVDRFGGLDVALANAAVVVQGDILSVSEANYDRVQASNMKGYFLTNQAAARVMTESGKGGAIINMSSIQAVITNPNMLVYAMCKGGVAQLTKAAALALARKNVRVNAIAPGSMNTEMFAKIAADPKTLSMAMSRTPMARPGEPEEAASVAVFLACDESSYITGETITVDGGRMGLNYVMPVD
ncbi:MAG: SDR family NAD(P)-dependent oxidoreductase [Rhodospirillales bacterium]